MVYFVAGVQIGDEKGKSYFKYELPVVWEVYIHICGMQRVCSSFMVPAQNRVVTTNQCICDSVQPNIRKYPKWLRLGL